MRIQEITWEKKGKTENDALHAVTVTWIPFIKPGLMDPNCRGNDSDVSPAPKKAIKTIIYDYGQ